MSKIQVQVEVSKETYEVCDAVESLLVDLKEKAAGGLTPAEIAQALSENIGKIMTAMEGADKIGAELAEDAAASAMAVSVMGAKVLGAFLKKQPAPAQAPSA